MRDECVHGYLFNCQLEFVISTGKMASYFLPNREKNPSNCEKSGEFMWQTERNAAAVKLPGFIANAITFRVEQVLMERVTNILHSCEI